jgi:hypothetical protein
VGRWRWEARVSLPRRLEGATGESRLLLLYSIVSTAIEMKKIQFAKKKDEKIQPRNYHTRERASIQVDSAP